MTKKQREEGLGLSDPRTDKFRTFDSIVHEYIKNNLRFTCESIIEQDNTGSVYHPMNTRIPVPVRTKLFVHLDEEIITEVVIKEEWI